MLYTFVSILSIIVFATNMLLSPAPAVQTPYRGMWVTGAELQRLPTSGPAWDALLKAANTSPGTPAISNQDSNNDVLVLAKALVFARTGETKYRDAVISNLKAAIGTEDGGRTLALGRNLVSYVISADLINLPSADPTFDKTFRSWLAGVRTETLDGRTLISTHEDRPNNWGTHAGASRVAADLYLGDQADLDRAATVFRGYLGDRNAYASFAYGDDLSWQCDPSKPVGVNPYCVKNGFSLDGALPEEMRRGSTFTVPPTATGYPWEAMQGALVQALLLHRAGYPAFEWSNYALYRAAIFLYGIGWTPTGDDEWAVWVLNHIYAAGYPAVSPARSGKNMGWTDWTLGATQIAVVPTPVPPTATPVLPTATAVKPTSTTIPPTATAVPPTPTAPVVVVVPPTATPTAVPTLQSALEIILYPPYSEAPVRMYCFPAP